MSLWRTDPRTEGFHFHICSPPAMRRLGPLLVVAAVSSGIGGGRAFAQAKGLQTSDKLTTPLSVEWKYTGNYFGNNPASPVVVKDSAIFVTGNHAYAVSLRTGALRWRYPSDSATALPWSSLIAAASS